MGNKKGSYGAHVFHPVMFDIQEMHSHLVGCLKAEKMSMFPCF